MQHERCHSCTCSPAAFPVAERTATLLSLVIITPQAPASRLELSFSERSYRCPIRYANAANIRSVPKNKPIIARPEGPGCRSRCQLSVGGWYPRSGRRPLASRPSAGRMTAAFCAWPERLLDPFDDGVELSLSLDRIEQGETADDPSGAAEDHLLVKDLAIVFPR